MDINLTINGNRNIPVSVPDNIGRALSDPNSEFIIEVVASPVGEDLKYSNDDQPPKRILKLKIDFIQAVRQR